jgi:hypothetical protein
MELDIHNIEHTASYVEVVNAIARVLHHEIQSNRSDDRNKLNLQVSLGKGCGGLRNNGKGDYLSTDTNN